jgi:hypothetical protein
MNAIQRMQFDDLVARYRDQMTPFQSVLELRYWPPRTLRARRLVGGERRRALRRLLDFYGLLELAAISGVIGSDFPDGFRQLALRNVDFAVRADVIPIRLFRDPDFPLVLRLRSRLERGEGVVEDSANGAFREFLALNGCIEDDPDTEALWESLQTGRGSSSGFVETLSNPEAFIRAYASHRSPVERQLHGLLKILTFSEEFESFWQQQRETPAFQQAALEYEWKWYQHRELEYLTQQLLDRFVTWNHEGAGEAAECLRCVATLVQRSRPNRV